MNILLLVASNSGSTITVAQIVSSYLSSNGISVTTKNPKDAHNDDIEKSDGILFASPSWDYEGKEGQPHEDFLPILKSLESKQFEGKPVAILGLGDSSYTYYCGAVDVFEEFVKKLNGKLIIPSLRIDRYYQKSENAALVQAWAEKLLQKLKIVTT